MEVKICYCIFLVGVENNDFLHQLLLSLSSLEPKFVDVQDVWMNDEVILSVESSMGNFLLSKDIWDMAFIMADNNQPVLYKIDEILSVDNYFDKIPVDFNEFN